MQTPASYRAVLKGVQRRLDREEEASVASSHLTAAFGRVERLHPLPHWLGRLRAAKAPPQEPGAILAKLVALADSGLMEMTVSRRETDRGER